jgi:hypothetical protein
MITVTISICIMTGSFWLTLIRNPPACNDAYDYSCLRLHGAFVLLLPRGEIAKKIKGRPGPLKNKSILNMSRVGEIKPADAAAANLISHKPHEAGKKRAERKV